MELIGYLKDPSVSFIHRFNHELVFKFQYGKNEVK
jgi:hypothetical protein